MAKFNRVFVIVLDSMGIGAMPDSEKFGDVGVDTLGHICDAVEHFQIPNLRKLGLANLKKLSKVAPVEHPLGYYMEVSEASNGKDTKGETADRVRDVPDAHLEAPLILREPVSHDSSTRWPSESAEPANDKHQGEDDCRIQRSVGSEWKHSDQNHRKCGQNETDTKEFA